MCLHPAAVERDSCNGGSLKILDCSQFQFQDWDQALSSRTEYSFFHCQAWERVVSNSYGYNPLYFASSRENPAVIPVMEVRSLLTGRRGVSLPFSDYCDPLVEDRKSFEALLDGIIDYGRKAGWKYIELRGGERFLSDAPVFATYLVHTLALCRDEQKLLSSFKGNIRQGINRATHEGVEVEFLTNFQAVREFYQLHCITRKRQGVPPQPFHFFRKIYEHIISKNLGFVILASHENKNIAGAIYFHLGKRALYKYGASDKSYQHLRANNLVMWEAIKWYSLNGCTSFCFGRTDPDNKGLRQFKNGWGTVEKEIYYYRYDIQKDKFIDGNTEATTRYRSLMQKLPMPVLRLIGQVSYRHVG